jgi:Rps23 Pro-64 3,4-dihydroxylase Tpa1-like proline 4-hydroxylase
MTVRVCVCVFVCVFVCAYVYRDWKEEWGGHLALWEGSLEGLRASSLDGLSWGSGEGEEEEGLGGGVGKKGGQDRRRNERGGARIVRAGAAAEIAPIFNRAVLFRTSDISWHGMPDAVSCPEGTRGVRDGG